MKDAVLQVRLTGRAARFVSLLQEFGHLDLATTDAFLLAIADFCGEEGEVLADLPQVRRLAASWLFVEEEEEMSRVLQDDWTLLFS